MIDKELSRKIKEEARALGLCDEWYNKWGDASVQDMLYKFKRGFDFVLKHRDKWLKPDYIRNTVNVDVLRNNQILANDKWSLLNQRECFLLGDSESIVRYNAGHHGTVWITGTSHVDIYMRGRSHAVVHLFDYAQLNVKLKEPTAKLIAIVHGEDTLVLTTYTDDAIIKYEEDYR